MTFYSPMINRAFVAFVLSLAALSATSCGDPTPASGPCADVTCSDHGTCEVQDGKAVCVCDSGYTPTGSQCISNDSPCAGVTCSDHGSCTLQDGKAVCVCDSGYTPTGLQCISNDSPCAGETCSGHGTCTVEFDLPYCVCDEPYVVQAALQCVLTCTGWGC